MSAYATLADFAIFGLNSATVAGLASTTLTAHLAAASAVADGYLNSRFKLPLTVWGVDLTQKVCELAAYTILKTRGFDPNDPGDRSIYEAGLAATAWLVRISEGEVTPLVTDSSGTPGQYGGPNTAQMSVQAVSTEASSGSMTQQVDTGGTGGQVFVGAPRQRGWR